MNLRETGYGVITWIELSRGGAQRVVNTVMKYRVAYK